MDNPGSVRRPVSGFSESLRQKIKDQILALDLLQAGRRGAGLTGCDARAQL